VYFRNYWFNNRELEWRTRDKSADVDWKNIAGMRKKLIHAYFGVNLPLVWETVKTDLPQLKKHTVLLLKNL
jgi:uncharacterized protein with HEPN domain